MSFIFCLIISDYAQGVIFIQDQRDNSLSQLRKLLGETCSEEEGKNLHLYVFICIFILIPQQKITISSFSLYQACYSSFAHTF